MLLTRVGLVNLSLISIGLSADLSQTVTHFLGFPLEDISTHISAGWLYDDNVRHKGIDYPAPRGTKVLAAADGMAMTSVEPLNPNNPTKNRYGTFVLIKHDNGYSTLYAHLDTVEPSIQAFPADQRYNSDFLSWSRVNRGDPIGTVGNSGVPNKGTHLHFEVAQNSGGAYAGHVQGQLDPYTLFNARRRFTARPMAVCSALGILRWKFFPVMPVLLVIFISLFEAGIRFTAEVTGTQVTAC